MKNYKLWKVGDMCKITRTHGDDLGKIGKIVEVRPSFCKIEIEGYKKPLNHCYTQFIKVDENGDEIKTETNNDSTKSELLENF